MNKLWTLILGGGMVAFGVHGLFETVTLKTRGGRATGTVVAPKDSQLAGATRAPVIEFVAADGRRYSLVTARSINPGYRVGEQVPVLYHTAKPGDARVDSFWNNWPVPVVFIGFGGWGLLWALGFVRTRDGLSPLASRHGEDRYDDD